MGKKHAHVSVAAYWVPSDKPQFSTKKVSKKHQASSAVARKLDPKQRARIAAASKKGKGKGGKDKKKKR
jgi:ethanolamine utilization microcompartment shell protein EutL